MLALVPTATILVDDNEADLYAPHVPKKQLDTIPPQTCIGALRQAILDKYDEEIIVMLDDDLRHVQVDVGRKPRNITDPESIRWILENAANVASDMGCDLFGFTKDPNPMHFQPSNPFHLSRSVVAAIGYIGRTCKYDLKLATSEDLDINLQALQHGRIVYMDTRFAFNFGAVGECAGGLQGIRSTDNMNASDNAMISKWGQFVKTRKTNKGVMVTESAVVRKSPITSTK